MKTISRIVLLAAGLALAPTLASADNHAKPWLRNHQDQHDYHAYKRDAWAGWGWQPLYRHDNRRGWATHYATRDGHISSRERRYLNNAYSHQSRYLYRQRHDDCGRR